MGFLSRHRKRLIITLAAIYSIYLVSLGLVLPAVVKHMAPKELGELLNREVSVETFRINPFTLAVTVEDFVIASHKETPLFEFERFHANFELSSLWRKSLHFKVIELIGPQGAIEQLSKGKLDIDDLLALADSEDEPEEISEEEIAIPAFSVDTLTIQKAGFQITDHSRQGSPRLHITPVSFDIEHLSTVPTEEGGNRYEFHATGPSGGSLTWLGQLTFAPLTVEGTLALDQLALSPFADFFNEFVAAELATGELSLSNHYRFSYDEEVRLTLTDGNLSLSNITLLDGLGSEEDNTLLKLKALNLEGFSLDTIDSKVVANSLTLDTPQVLADLTRDGKINWLEAVSPIEHTAPASKSAAEESPMEESPEGENAAEENIIEESASDTNKAPSTEDEETKSNAEPSPDWQVIANAVVLKDGRLRLNDNNNADAGTLEIHPINLSVQNIHWPSDTPLALALAVDFGSGGSLVVDTEGTLEPIAFSGDIQLANFPLEPLNPWVAEQMPLQFDSGTAFIEQAFELQINAEDEVDLSATGRAQIDDLSLREIGKRTLAAWQSVAVENTQLNLVQQELLIGKVLLNGVNSSLTLAADGSSWLDIFADEETSDATASTDTEPSQDWRVAINEIEFKDNQLSYHDGTMTPAFRISMNRLSGKLTNIDTAGNKESQFNLTARIDGNAPLAVSGKGFLLDENLNIEVNTKLNDYEMTRLSPFTGSFLGYVTDSGQLSLDSKLQIKENLLDTSNKVVAKRFYLGDKVDSPEAINAPIKLGLSVLRDRRENISLPVAAKGDLADPSVSVSKIILRTFTNILVRAATSPFSVLMGLGGGAEQEYLAFTPGSTQLDQGSETMVATLAKALQDRPKLRLTLTGSAALPDQRAMATGLVGDDILGRHWAGLEQALDDDKFHKKTLKAWNKLEQDTELSGSEREQTETAFEQLVQVKMQQLDESALLTLANYRADQLKALLVDEHGLDGSRITVANSVISNDDEAGVKLDISSR